MSTICRFNALTKSYSHHFSLGPINLEIRTGELIGLLGQNGAGKTTLLRLMIDALWPSSGSLELWGRNHRTNTRHIKERIGYVDEEPILYDWMEASDLERFLRPYYPRWSSQRFEGYVRRLEVPEHLCYGKLSRGNKVKLSIAAALAKQPELLILDEPTSGLDPVVRQEILDLLRDFKKSRPPASIFFSSHILTDLEQICSRVIVLDKGRILADAPLAEIYQLHAGAACKQVSLETLFLKLIGKGGTHAANCH